jgi:8-amino-7-oxononanoate synthase
MERIETLISKRTKAGLLRTLHPIDARSEGRLLRSGKVLLDFSSNDYLALSTHPTMKEAGQRAIEALGTGATASRLLSGDLELHHELERRTAHFKGKPAALVLNSGYQANVGIISVLCQKGDLVLCDRLCHASILDGIRLSHAGFHRFIHNDMNHLERLLQKTQAQSGHRMVITESVFSMDGDRAPLKQIVELKERYGFSLYVDEAHATGVFGDHGAGVVEQEGITDQVDFIMGTFSKALGSFGAYVACSQLDKTYLINACRSFIYSTALPPAVIASNIAALKIIETEPERRTTLLRNAEQFRTALKAKGLEVLGESQIIPVVTGETTRTLKVSQALQDSGCWVLPIRAPTVPAGSARLRFTVTHWHDQSVLGPLSEQVGALCHA